MKKLVFTLGAIVLAGAVNAAAVTWNSGTYALGFKDYAGTTLANSTAYTMTVTFYQLIDTSYTAVATTGTTSSSKGSMLGTYSGTTGTTDFAADSTYYLKAVIASDEYMLVTADYVAFTTPGDNSNANLNLMSGSGFATSGVKWETTSTGALNWTAVPEPTSGLLLLVGGALLALKRKRA